MNTLTNIGNFDPRLQAILTALYSNNSTNNNLLTDISSLLFLILSEVSNSNIDDKIGYSETYTYYSGLPGEAAANPSGNKNVKTITKVYGTTTVITTFTYDIDDDVLTIINT